MNFKTLILCFLAAAVFWLLNALNKTGYSTKINYPIEVIYDDSRYIPVSPLPKTIKVDLSSTGWNLLKNNFSFNISPLLYEVGNPMAEKQLSTKVLMEKLSAKLKDSRINEINADTLAINFERLYKKKVILKVDSLNVDLEKNFVISSLINVIPSEVIVEGPASELKEYPGILYLKVPVKNLAVNFDDKMAIPLPKKPLVKISAEQAAISFEVAELLK